MTWLKSDVSGAPAAIDVLAQKMAGAVVEVTPGDVLAVLEAGVAVLMERAAVAPHQH